MIHSRNVRSYLKTFILLSSTILIHIAHSTNLMNQESNPHFDASILNVDQQHYLCGNATDATVYGLPTFDPAHCTWNITLTHDIEVITVGYTVQLNNTNLYLSVWKEAPYWQRLYLEDTAHPKPHSDHQWSFSVTLISPESGVSGIFFVENKNDPQFPLPYAMTYEETHQSFTAVTAHEQFIQHISLLNNLFTIKATSNQ